LLPRAASVVNAASVLGIPYDPKDLADYILRVLNNDKNGVFLPGRCRKICDYMHALGTGKMKSEEPDLHTERISA
jgi:hypothetical protein